MGGRDCCAEPLASPQLTACSLHAEPIESVQWLLRQVSGESFKLWFPSSGSAVGSASDLYVDKFISELEPAIVEEDTAVAFTASRIL